MWLGSSKFIDHVRHTSCVPIFNVLAADHLSDFLVVSLIEFETFAHALNVKDRIDTSRVVPFPQLGNDLI